MRVLAVVGFIWVRRVHKSAPMVSLGSLWLIGSILMRSGVEPVHSVSLE